jgi:hypothetical protein
MMNIFLRGREGERERERERETYVIQLVHVHVLLNTLNVRYKGAITDIKISNEKE